jgi:hypothetical protein
VVPVPSLVWMSAPLALVSARCPDKEESESATVTRDSFEVLSVLGSGEYGRVPVFCALKA